MNFSASSDYCKDARFIQHSVILHHIYKLKFRPEDAVLDVGCGTGEETTSIAEKVRNVTGIDVSDEMIHVAVQNNSAVNVHYCKGDAQNAGDNPEWREKFDKTVCFFVIHWVSDVIGALRSIHTCLKSDGEALFIIRCRDRRNIVEEATRFLADHQKWGRYVKGFRSTYHVWNRSVRGTQELFSACGWSSAECEIRTHELHMSEARLKSYLKTVLGQTGRIPQPEVAEYLDDLWKWALAHFQSTCEDGYISLSMDFIVIHARK